MTDGTSAPGTSREPALLLAGALAFLGLMSLRLGPKSDAFTYLMETFPILLGAPVLAATRRRFPLTPLACRLLFVHACVLVVGGHWTYAEVPAGNWIREALGLERNHYDRLGHFLQGFVPALVFREILLRTSPLRPGRWLSFLTVTACMALSASYEFLEWWTAVLVGQGADAFLGTQGDPWDTQWDMFLAAVGAAASLLVLSRVHDRQIARLPPDPRP
jgi:putative membrane protein